MKLDLAKTNGTSPPSTTTRSMVGNGIAIVAAAVTAATRPTPHDVVSAALEEPAIKAAIHRGTRKAKVKKYAALTQRGHHGVREYTSDFVQATYLALLEQYAEEFAALTTEQRPQFLETLAMRIAWHEVYPVKRWEPLAKPFDGDQAGNETSPQMFACDDISLNGRNRHPDWMSAHAEESKLIESIDMQRAQTPPQEESETKYERMSRVLGEQNAGWMLDYENSRYKSAKPPKDRVKYHRLRKRMKGM